VRAEVAALCGRMAAMHAFADDSAADSANQAFLATAAGGGASGVPPPTHAIVQTSTLRVSLQALAASSLDRAAPLALAARCLPQCGPNAPRQPTATAAGSGGVAPGFTGGGSGGGVTGDTPAPPAHRPGDSDVDFGVVNEAMTWASQRDPIDDDAGLGGGGGGGGGGGEDSKASSRASSMSDAAPGRVEGGKDADVAEAATVGDERAEADLAAALEQHRSIAGGRTRRVRAGKSSPTTAPTSASASSVRRRGGGTPTGDASGGARGRGDAAGAAEGLECEVALVRRRSHKILCAQLAGCYLVTRGWPKSCSDTGGITHELPYRVAGDRATEALRPAILCGVDPLLFTRQVADIADKSSLSLTPQALRAALVSASAPARAHVAVSSGDPRKRLLACMTLVCWGIFEAPPKTLTKMEVKELAALGGVEEVHGAETGDTLPLACLPLAATMEMLSPYPSLAGAAAAVAAVLASPPQHRSGRKSRGGASGAGGSGGSVGPSTAGSHGDDVAVATARWRGILDRMLTRMAPPTGDADAWVPPTFPPLVILCDESWSVPPPVAVLAAPAVGLAAVVAPEWLTDTCAAYALLNPALAEYAV